MELGPFEYADKLPLKHGLRRRGRAGRSGCLRPPRLVPRPGRHLDAELREHRRPRRRAGRWSTPGRRSGRARRSANGSTSRAASGSAACSSRRTRVPVVVEDEVLIGSRSMITQGARVGRGAVLGEGTILNPSIPVIDVESGEELGTWRRAAVVRRGRRACGAGSSRRRVLPALRARRPAPTPRASGTTRRS